MLSLCSAPPQGLRKAPHDSGVCWKQFVMLPEEVGTALLYCTALPKSLCLVDETSVSKDLQEQLAHKHSTNELIRKCYFRPLRTKDL